MRVARHKQMDMLTVLYDARCPLCRRTVAVLLAFDWLDLLRPVANTALASLNPDMRASIGDADPAILFLVLDASGHRASGYEAYRAIADRLVPLWPLRRLLGAPSVRRLGASVYDRVSRSRQCEVRDTVSVSEVEVRLTRPVTRAMRLGSALVLLSLVGVGSTHVVRTWPIACYPTFDAAPGVLVDALVLEMEDAGGHKYDWTLSFDSAMSARMGSDRWRGLLTEFLDPARPPSVVRSRALVALWLTHHRTLTPVSFRLFVDSYHLTLSPMSGAPLSRRAVMISPERWVQHAWDRAPASRRIVPFA
jgi:predicted DCC family thiol-disulfide oxidoreductase YuxK